jgi:hypothetical protein
MGEIFLKPDDMLVIPLSSKLDDADRQIYDEMCLEAI